MKTKKISGKWMIILAVFAGLVAIIVFFTIHFRKSENSYRSIQIYELQGSATIEREGVGVIDAIENLYLRSGDRIEVSQDSFLRLKLDDDKYIMVEENSVLSIVAKGTKENSRTSIHLEQGAITNEIQSKLSESSSYEVTTPNSVMAVRGTVFRVEVTLDEKKEVYTKVSTFEGKVDAKVVYSDGRVEEKTVPIEQGKETIIHLNGEETEYEIELKEIDYEALPVQALESLKEVAEHDTTLEGIKKEELDTLIEEKKEESMKATEEKPDEEGTKPSEGATEEPGTEQNSDSFLTTEEGRTETTEKNTEDTLKKETEESTEEPPEKVKIHTVTFLYQGSIFGTQQVEDGQKVAMPKLAPANAGAWDFDFSSPVKEDITIEWK